MADDKVIGRGAVEFRCIESGLSCLLTSFNSIDADKDNQAALMFGGFLFWRRYLVRIFVKGRINTLLAINSGRDAINAEATILSEGYPLAGTVRN